MFVMPNLERNDVNMTYHVAQSKSNTIKTQLMTPRRRLRLCPRANKNLHIPAGYAESILLHNICLQGDMQIFYLLLGYAQGIPSAPGSLLLQLFTYMSYNYPTT
ncbi:hypothetical protein T01_9735 [Trichinella spiralis]|uniref:Uncharacterized protein n=1 Tax=Trichinella spiralis TaxID=6334 RepID=A0A0V1BWR1_TRISP|nr:hypothetical protein T01_9735 [Trichinella spiralis]